MTLTVGSLGVVGTNLVRVDAWVDDDLVEVTHLDGRYVGQQHRVLWRRVGRWWPVGGFYLRKELMTVATLVGSSNLDDIDEGRRILAELMEAIQERARPVRGDGAKPRRRGPYQGPAAEEIEGRRRAMGMTWAELAAAIGISVGGLSKYELGQRRTPEWVLEAVRLVQIERQSQRASWNAQSLRSDKA